MSGRSILESVIEMVGLRNVEEAQGMRPVKSQGLLPAAGEEKWRQMDKNDADEGISSLQDRIWPRQEFRGVYYLISRNRFDETTI